VQKAPDALLFALESPHVLKDIKPKEKDLRCNDITRGEAEKRGMKRESGIEI